ncbi:MAG TPA: N-acetylmuramoyl-L-alanine amidase [Bacteroidia bacterium]
MLKLKFTLLVALFMCMKAFLGQTSADVFQERYNNYLNFNGSLNPYISITSKDVRIYKNSNDKNADLPELMIDFSEIKIFEYLLKYAPQDSIDAILKRKGAKKWTKKKIAEMQILYEEEPHNYTVVKPLDGKKIVIDPGHIAGNADMAFTEQKYIRFVKDSFASLPLDSVKIQEGVLTYATASILKKQLEEQGATVILSRGNNKTVFGITYNEWLQQRKQKVLDSLKSINEMDAVKYKRLNGLDSRTFFWEFFRDFELAARARYINKQNPDLTIIIHYNVDEKNVPWSRPSDKNFTMVFMPGAFSAETIKSINGKANFLRLLLTEDLPLSEKISDLTVKEFSKTLHIPIASKSDAEYLKENCLSPKNNGVYSRNLALCRNVKAPLVYGECLYQDNHKEYMELSKTDKTYFGIQTNARVKAVSDAYFNAIMQFYKK